MGVFEQSNCYTTMDMKGLSIMKKNFHILFYRRGRANNRFFILAVVVNFYPELVKTPALQQNVVFAK